MKAATMFIDESNYTNGRFRSIGALTVAEEAIVVRVELAEQIARLRHRELKWQELATADSRLCALGVLEIVLREVSAGRMRADSFIWDTYDTRHTVPGRSDAKNLAAMIRFLATDIVGLRWPEVKKWSLQSDQQSQVVFSGLQNAISLRAARKAGTRPEEDATVVALPDSRSEDEPFIQVADLLAGLGVYARENAAAIHPVLVMEADDIATLVREKRSPLGSNRERERFLVIDELLKFSAAKSLGVRFSKKMGFESSGAAASFRFWHYEPQGSYDKAPGSKVITVNDDTSETQVYSCSVKGCNGQIELAFRPTRPLCSEHHAEQIEIEEARAAAATIESAQRDGNYICEECFAPASVTTDDVERAASINRKPQCPSCSRWSLIPTAGDLERQRSTDELISEFELKRKRY